MGVSGSFYRHPESISGSPFIGDAAIAALRGLARGIPLARDGACGAGAFSLLCIERLKGMFISFFPGEERNEPKKEATDQ